MSGYRLTWFETCKCESCVNLAPLKLIASSLELEGYDPRGLLIPPNPGLRSLTVRDVQDADDWLEELLSLPSGPNSQTQLQPRFSNLHHLSLHSTTLLSFPTLPLTRLTHLDLSLNLLNAIPSSLSSLSALQSLNLSNNLITSLRNAPSALGNITSLNLSRNRIDCIVGLERILGLERIDVRSNELAEYDEVGRLAVLPHIREVWCVNNPFDRPGDGEDWRIELGVTFAAEGRAEMIFDDRPWTWSESRRIESALASRGRTAHPRGLSAESSYQAQRAVHTSTPPQTSSSAAPADGGARVVPTSPASSAVGQKKRRPRRVINLDAAGDQGSDGEPRSELVGGSLRLPRSTGVIEEEEGSVQAERNRRRARVTTSLFEPRTG